MPELPIDSRRYAAATLRNRQPILDVLRRVLPAQGTILEVASGSGEHVVYFARHLPALIFQPSDFSREALASIDSWRALEALPNVLPAVQLDAASADWPIRSAAAVMNINMVHISPWSCALGLFAGAARVLPDDGVLFMYGPYKMGGVHTAPSNERFDASLRAENPEWGVRDLEALQAAALRRGLRFEEAVPMPANNYSLVFRKSR